MRPLTDEELSKVFSKLAKYIGDNVSLLIERDDGSYAFRLHKDRVYYSSEVVKRAASCVEREKLQMFGSCLGKFTKTHQFRLHITALDYLAPYARYKIWLKPSGEQSYLYGNHVLKSNMARITEGTPCNAGVVMYSMADIPLGFGVTAKSAVDCRKCEATSIVALHQTDIGEYLRSEDTLT